MHSCCESLELVNERMTLVVKFHTFVNIVKDLGSHNADPRRLGLTDTMPCSSQTVEFGRYMTRPPPLSPLQTLVPLPHPAQKEVYVIYFRKSLGVFSRHSFSEINLMDVTLNVSLNVSFSVMPIPKKKERQP